MSLVTGRPETINTQPGPPEPEIEVVPLEEEEWDCCCCCSGAPSELAPGYIGMPGYGGIAKPGTAAICPYGFAPAIAAYGFIMPTCVMLAIPKGGGALR